MRTITTLAIAALMLSFTNIRAQDSIPTGRDVIKRLYIYQGGEQILALEIQGEVKYKREILNPKDPEENQVYATFIIWTNHKGHPMKVTFDESGATTYFWSTEVVTKKVLEQQNLEQKD